MRIVLVCLTILGINALVLLAIGVAIAAKNRLFLPQNRLRFSLDDIVRIAYRGSHRKIEWGLSKIFSKKIKKFFKNPLTNQKYVL